jgi:hypothetical protein
MRLIRALEKVEAAVEAKKKRRVGPVGICFTADEVKLDREHLDPAQRVAVDLHVLLGEGLYLQVRAVERLAHDAGDLGDVYGSDGLEKLGRIAGEDGAFLTVDWIGGGLQDYRARVAGAKEPTRKRAGG